MNKTVKQFMNNGHWVVYLDEMARALGIPYSTLSRWVDRWFASSGRVGNKTIIRLVDMQDFAASKKYKDYLLQRQQETEEQEQKPEEQEQKPEEQEEAPEFKKKILSLELTCKLDFYIDKMLSDLFGGRYDRDE